MTEPRPLPWLALILLAGLVLRVQGLDWDRGLGLHPDEGNLVRASLDLSWSAPVPAFHAYNDLSLWLPKFLAAPVCDDGDARCLRLAARLLSTLFSAAAVGVMALVARALAGPAAGLATAALAATSWPLVQWAHFGTTESALVLLMPALWLVALRWLQGGIGDRGMALCSGALLGLGFGMKTTALGLAAIPLTALALRGRPDVQRLRAVALGAALSMLLALASTPSLIFATADWLAVMRFENGVVHGTADVFWTRQFHAARNVWFEMRQLWSATHGAGLLLALAGLASLPRATRRAALPGLAFALIYAALSFGWHAKFFRYLAPLLPVVLVLAGIGAARLIGSTLQSLRVAGMTGLGLCLIAGIDFASGYRFADPRLLAETAIARLTGPADPIAIEPHDLGLTAGRPVTVLTLDDPGATPETLAQVLSGSKAMLIASRRNWAVLPGHPATAALTCGFYAALARGDLGFRLHRTFARQTLFGPLFAPGPGTEETATVFDRPTVLLLLNEAQLPAAEIAARIAAPADPATCTPVALQAEWDRPR